MFVKYVSASTTFVLFCCIYSCLRSVGQLFTRQRKVIKEDGTMIELSAAAAAAGRADDAMMQADTDCPNAVLAGVVNQELCVDVSGLTAQLPLIHRAVVYIRCILQRF